VITLFFLKTNASGVFIGPTNIQLVQKYKIYEWLEMTQLGSPKMAFDINPKKVVHCPTSAYVRQIVVLD
jgi:hypothetical protein